MYLRVVFKSKLVILFAPNINLYADIELNLKLSDKVIKKR